MDRGSAGSELDSGPLALNGLVAATVTKLIAGNPGGVAARDHLEEIAQSEGRNDVQGVVR